MTDIDRLEALLSRMAAALERASPLPAAAVEFDAAEAFVWHGDAKTLQPVERVKRIPLSLLKGIDRAAGILLDNTRRFARGLPANNALLWGARGMGKSSLVKAVHAEVVGAGGLPAKAGIDEGESPAPNVKLVEIHREEIATLSACLAALKSAPFRFIVFCDDLSFERDDASYKSLKGVLEGGVEGRPDNVIFYATSNRRHLMPRDMIENERASAVNPSEAAEEKISLSDRFGLWLGFHNASQDDYLGMVRAYVAHFKLPISEQDLKRDALEWATTRGARSGRVAWQYTLDLAGRLGVKL